MHVRVKGAAPYVHYISIKAYMTATFRRVLRQLTNRCFNPSNVPCSQRRTRWHNNGPDSEKDEGVFAMAYAYALSMTMRRARRLRPSLGVGLQQTLAQLPSDPV